MLATTANLKTRLGITDATDDTLLAAILAGVSAQMAIATGRYPSPPARSLYLISKGVPSSPAVKAFLKFILQQGQEIIPQAGYVCLDSTLVANGKLHLEEVAAKP